MNKMTALDRALSKDTQVQHGSISLQHQGMQFAMHRKNVSACEELWQKPQILLTCGLISEFIVCHL